MTREALSGGLAAGWAAVWPEELTTSPRKGDSTMNTAVANEVIPQSLGEPFAGGFYAGQIRVGDRIYALVAAPKAEGEHEDVALLTGKKLDVPAALSFFDGAANTAALAEAGSKAAKWAQALAIGGFTDWHIPSRDELELLYRAFKPTTDENYCWRGDNPSSVPVGYAYIRDVPAQTAIEAFRESGAEAFETEWYWSSTQYAGDESFAWIQNFYDGLQGDDHKGYDYRVRAVRRVAI